MNRRNFLTKLTMVPLAGTLLHASKVNADVSRNADNKWLVFSPEEIAKHWIYVDNPSFIGNDGKMYYTLTWKLKSWMPHEFFTNAIIKQDKELIQYLVKKEIYYKHQLTHIHWIRFFETPVVRPDGTLMHTVWVRGININYPRGYFPISKSDWGRVFE